MLSSPLLSAAGKSKVELTDGSVIEGEMISLENDVYRIKSDSLGEVKINSSKVRSITAAGASAGATERNTSPANPDIDAVVDNLQLSAAASPEKTQALTDLLSDPEIKDILDDPEIMGQVSSRDVQSLSKNKKFVNLLNNSRLKQAKDKLTT